MSSKQTLSHRPAKLVSKAGRIALGTMLVLVGLLLVALLVTLWPAVEKATTKGVTGDVDVSLLGFVNFSASPGTTLILLVVVAASIGSYIHTATSFTDYVGNRRLVTSWTWWYLLRVFVGVSIALVVYFALRGGFFTGADEASFVNPYGVAALAGLAGMFHKLAADKLEQIFRLLLQPHPGEGDDRRLDSLVIVNPSPELLDVQPRAVAAGADREQFQALGSNFVADSRVRVRRAGGNPLRDPETSFTDPTDLGFALLAEHMAEAGTLEVTVVNPEPGGGTSAAISVEVEAEGTRGSRS